MKNFIKWLRIAACIALLAEGLGRGPEAIVVVADGNFFTGVESGERPIKVARLS